MTKETLRAASAPTPATPGPISQNPNQTNVPAPARVLSPGEWIRAVSDIEAPFGFDRMPTVLG